MIHDIHSVKSALCWPLYQPRRRSRPNKARVQSKPPEVYRMRSNKPHLASFSLSLSLRALSSVPSLSSPILQLHKSTNPEMGGLPYHLHPHPFQFRLVPETLQVQPVVEERWHGLPLVPRHRSDLRDDVLRERNRAVRRRRRQRRGFRRGGMCDRGVTAGAVVARIDVVVAGGGGSSQTRRRTTTMTAHPLTTRGGPHREGVVDGRIEQTVESHYTGPE